MCDKQLLLKAFFPLVFEFFHILTVNKHFDKVLLRASLFCITSSGSVQHLVVFNYFLQQQLISCSRDLPHYFLSMEKDLQMSPKIP